MLIRVYGQFWNPNTVDWGTVGAGNKGHLKGRVRIKQAWHTIDFWDAKGIYVLHDQFRPVYVGKAWSVELGKRLRDHLTDRHAGRWDMFSWFSTSTVNTTNPGVRKPGQRQLKPETVVDTLEALAILIADPPLNRRRESITDAAEAEQVQTPHPKSIRDYLEEILKKLEDDT